MFLPPSSNQEDIEPPTDNGGGTGIDDGFVGGGNEQPNDEDEPESGVGGFDRLNEIPSEDNAVPILNFQQTHLPSIALSRDKRFIQFRRRRRDLTKSQCRSWTQSFDECAQEHSIQGVTALSLSKFVIRGFKR